jgi:hypothetical protein
MGVARERSTTRTDDWNRKEDGIFLAGLASQNNTDTRHDEWSAVSERSPKPEASSVKPTALSHPVMALSTHQ